MDHNVSLVCWYLEQLSLAWKENGLKEKVIWGKTAIQWKEKVFLRLSGPETWSLYLPRFWGGSGVEVGSPGSYTFLISVVQSTKRRKLALSCMHKIYIYRYSHSLVWTGLEFLKNQSPPAYDGWWKCSAPQDPGTMDAVHFLLAFLKNLVLRKKVVKVRGCKVLGLKFVDLTA